MFFLFGMAFIFFFFVVIEIINLSLSLFTLFCGYSVGLLELSSFILLFDLAAAALIVVTLLVYASPCFLFETNRHRGLV